MFGRFIILIIHECPKDGSLTYDYDELRQASTFCFNSLQSHPSNLYFYDGTTINFNVLRNYNTYIRIYIT